MLKLLVGDREWTPRMDNTNHHLGWESKFKVGSKNYIALHEHDPGGYKMVYIRPTKAGSEMGYQFNFTGFTLLDVLKEANAVIASLKQMSSKDEKGDPEPEDPEPEESEESGAEG